MAEHATKNKTTLTDVNSPRSPLTRTTTPIASSTLSVCWRWRRGTSLFEKVHHYVDEKTGRGLKEEEEKEERDGVGNV